MHPPISLIFFFITAGTSIGLFSLAYSAHLLGAFGVGEALPREALFRIGAIALVLVGAGAVGASFHLGHRLRAWKAVRRFRTSWLSREAVFSGAYGGALLLYLTALHTGASPSSVHILGGVALIFGILSAFSTAMIYASNRFVPEWNSPVTVIYFLLLYLMLGGVAFSYLSSLYALVHLKTSLALSLLFLILGLGFRVAFNVRQFYLKRPTLNDVLNLPHNRPVRLIDSGSTTGNYCTTEFYYRKGKELLPTVIPLAYLLTFIVPSFLILYTLWNSSANSWTLGLSYISLLLGAALERWCFFVEGNHVQNLFYGLYPGGSGSERV